MSRSRRKTPIFGITLADSDKADKRIANRRWRSRSRQAIRQGKEPPMLREVSDAWDFAKDGRHYWADATAKDKRK